MSAHDGLICFAARLVLLTVSMWFAGCGRTPHVLVGDEDDSSTQSCDGCMAGSLCVGSACSTMNTADATGALETSTRGVPVCEQDSDCAEHAACIGEAAEAACECVPGFVLQDLRCVDVNECATNNGGCAPDAVCENTLGARSCECKPGFIGDGEQCSDVDECLAADHDCGPLAMCSNIPGGYECTCPPGYEGDGRVCLDIDECDRNMDDCNDNARCQNEPGTYHCSCLSGFRSKGAFCEDIDECAANHGCDAATECKNTEGSYSCGDCAEGFSGGSESGCVDIDECAINFGDCAPNERCENTLGGRRCLACPSGLVRGDNGDCVDVDECSLVPERCGDNATCINRVGSFLCECVAGYQDNDGDGVCSANCAQAQGGAAFEGACVDCADDMDSWNSAADAAQAACTAACSEACTRPENPLDHCEYNDQSGTFTCSSFCGHAPTLECPREQRCSDDTGVARCTCPEGMQDNEGDGQCAPTCATATATTAPSYSGQCSNCGDGSGSQSAAQAVALAACQAEGECTAGCSDGSDCAFDPGIGGFICLAYCGPPPMLTCAPDMVCTDAGGTAECVSP